VLFWFTDLAAFAVRAEFVDGIGADAIKLPGGTCPQIPDSGDTGAQYKSVGAP